MLTLLAGLIGIAGSSLQCLTDPSEAARLLKLERQADVVSQMLDGARCEGLLMDGVATGQAEWINLAILLRSHVDASKSELLHDSLGRAMQVAPSRVLPLVGGIFDARICLPWMLDDSGKSDAEYRIIVAQARPMFESFLKTGLRLPAEKCLVEVEIAEGSPFFRVRDGF